jgi:chromosome segregation protein
MYLKSIEIHGFKSFANRIVFQFHNGITAIVGPNGSGKSNVADAVRWVLGEQSARQLRGASMQDVIFSGTEARKPLGYASVSITLDNSDHQLSVAYDEVTVTRRVYRSGESEYLLNGTQVRLRDVQELFYDTGIGKEGYSIIGQGQIEKILSGKPEERRELFDEAAGIVKFKRRKATTQKKLEDERQNLVRINDILSELTRQIGPMERQAETAKIYLEKRETLKSYEVQLFLAEVVRLKQELEQAERSYDTSSEQLARTKEAYEQAKTKYGQLEQELEQLERALQEKKDASADAQLEQQRLSGQIELMGEQINTARANEEHFQTRLEAVDREICERTQQHQQAAEELAGIRSKLETAVRREAQASAALEKVRGEIGALTDTIESGKNELIELLNGRAVLKANSQRYVTMMEQVSIRRAQLSQQVLQRKSEEAILQEQMDQAEREEREVTELIDELQHKSDEAGEQLNVIQQKLSDCNQRMEQEQVEYHREASRLESLKNIAERYDGYGSSIRRVMEQKERHPGIHGVVADLIKTEKEYETAVETALGGSIQNIVTDSEETARDMIAFLKRNKYGRATFLPLTGISSRGSFQNGQALKEPGMIGLASTLVRFEPQYRELIEYLLGKTLVADTIDHAIAIARKYCHTLRIVTLEGELLSPGGSMTGGAFRNTSNLLGRRREIEDLKHQVKGREKSLEMLQKENTDLRNERSRLRDAIVQLKDEMQKQYLAQNTARIRLQELSGKKEQAATGHEKLHEEAREIEQQIREIQTGQQDGQQELQRSEDEEIRLGEQSRDCQERLERKREEEKAAADEAEQTRMDVAQMQQQEAFIRQNLERLTAEKEHLEEEKQRLGEEITGSAGQIAGKRQEIEATRQAIKDAMGRWETLQKEITQLSDAREDKNRIYKKFFEHRESLSEQMNLLDRECFRLNAQKEKLAEQRDGQINYMWEEYGLTYTAALEQKSGENQPPQVLKRLIQDLKSEIKGLGNVNVNAIEEFRELSERHTFLTTQHDDIVRAEESLQKIILELDEGMRTQFSQQFGRIQQEFDKAFKELFGGGKGTLELVEDEDILEAGIRIIAQPPGKKLQNMMQMSGGEKALTAIALLFAIQNLKPSPFCLLDEIEAALDESNVDRYARYLHKLTKHTQFIIITHRRGTMTAADRLYGITMQEKGVSALVSVNLIEQELDE